MSIPYPTPAGVFIETVPVRLRMEVVTPDGYIWRLFAVKPDGSAVTLATLDEDQAAPWLAAMVQLKGET